MKRYRLTIFPQILGPLRQDENGDLVFYKDVEKRIDQLEDTIDLVIEHLSVQERMTPKELKEYQNAKVGGETLMDYLIRVLEEKPKPKRKRKSNNF